MRAIVRENLLNRQDAEGAKIEMENLRVLGVLAVKDWVRQEVALWKTRLLYHKSLQNHW
jgi:hypothetical protein